MERPFLGITGISEKEDINKCFKALGRYNYFSRIPSHNIMFGFLMNNTFKSQKKHYISSIEKLFDLLPLVNSISKLNRVFKVIHFNSPRHDFSKEISSLLHTRSLLLSNGMELNELIDGIQLNIVNPLPIELSNIKAEFPNLKIIFQLSDFDNTDLERYGIDFDYLLIDKSRGKGKGIDLRASNYVSFYKKLNEKYPNIIFAGGFGGDNVKDRVKRIVEILGNGSFSVDAQSLLRNKEKNELDQGKVNEYISNFIKAIEQI